VHALKKVARDFSLLRGRTLTIVAAIALGLVGFYGVLGAFGVLLREIRRNYVESAPASATLFLADVTPKLLAEVRARPEIAAATRRTTLHGRYRSTADDTFRRALVFVVDDFERAGVAKLFHERGERTPPRGTVLIERSALAALGGDVGSSFTLELPGAERRSVRVSGIVHEPALAPAKTEQAIYAYMTVETARDLGAHGSFDELRVLVRDNPGDRVAIERAAEELAAWITRAGFGKVEKLRVPPPLTHPHQTQMTAILLLFVAFGAVILVMGSFLAAALMGTLLTRQVREIGVMKAIGARTVGLFWLYVAAVVALSVTAVAAAWVPARLVTSAFTARIGELLNFDIQSERLPTWLVVFELSAGALIPLVVAAPRILRGCRVTVREALADHGMVRYGADRFLERFGPLSGLSGLTGHAFRGALRRRRQFVLSLGLLVAAGGGFIGAMSTAKGWDSLLGQIERTRLYDVEVHLNGTGDPAPLAARLRRMPEVRAVEIWRSTSVALARPGRTAIERTYPDDGHGAFHLVSPPDGEKLLQVELAEGRWLEAGDGAAVVVNQLVPGAELLKLGDELTLSVAGEARSLRVVGKAVQVGIGASAYVTARTFDMVVPVIERESELWVATAGHSGEASRAQLLTSLERELLAAGADVQAVVPVTMVKNAMAAHFEVLVNALLALAALIALIGSVGLGSALSVSVSERTRELGVLRAIGATARQVRGLVLLEGLSVGFLSLGGAVIVGPLLAFGVGSIVGRLSFRVALPWSISVPAVAGWAFGALAFAALGSIVPAWRASRSSVRAALVWLAVTVAIGAALLEPKLASAETARGTLTIQVTAFEHDKGPVIAKLFRRGDGAPRGAGFRKVVRPVRGRRATVTFEDIPWGTYAVFLFHDENGNGTVDHNFLGIPTEPLGFSNFKPGILTGVPTFDDLKFPFGPKAKQLAIAVD
jgi:putative ABC transport system permease protein